MSVYMTEEEQLEAIKKWWVHHQNWILAILSVLVLTVFAYRYWHWHTEKTMQEASVMYEKMILAVSKNDDKSIQGYANPLIKKFPNAIYANAAHLVLAKLFVNQHDYPQAESHLLEVMHSEKDPLKPIASIRLARVWAAQKHYDKALSALESMNGSPYDAVIQELKGDILSAQGEYSKAILAYNKAKNAMQADGQTHALLDMKSNVAASSLTL